MNLFEKLVDIIHDSSRVTTNQTIIEQHGKGLAYHAPHNPDVVVFIKTREEVSRVVSFANENKIPVVPFGAGSSLEGHIIPIYGGISLDFSLMNEIISVHHDDFIVKVQPGVTRNQLNKELKKYGLFFPVDPGADATIGGMSATNASGTNCVKYGCMRDQVLGLEIVMADGSIVNTGGMAIKSSAGYDLTGLFVGSEGTLGVFTEIILRLQGIPEETVAIKALFPSIEVAGDASSMLLNSGVEVGKIELVDGGTMKAVNSYKQTSFPEQATLFIELSGSPEAVKYDVELTKEVVMSAGCTSFKFETDSIARSKLWEARHHIAFAILAANPGKGLYSTDVCVPISELPGAIVETRKIVEEYGVEAGIFGHVGDGNYHSVVAVDGSDEKQIELMETIHHRIVSYALEKGGTCTGEHGIGLGKKLFLKEEHGESLELMLSIKRTFDPNNILNPGKIF